MSTAGQATTTAAIPRCQRKATWYLVEGPGIDDYTHACDLHVGALRSANTQAAYVIPEEYPCCYLEPAPPALPEALQAQVQKLCLADGDVLVMHLPRPTQSQEHADRIMRLLNTTLKMATGRDLHPILLLEPGVILEVISANSLTFKPKPDTLDDEIHRAYSRKLPAKE